MAKVSYEPVEGNIDATWEEVLKVFMDHLAEENAFRHPPSSFSACLRPDGMQEVKSLSPKDTIDITFWEKR